MPKPHLSSRPTATQRDFKPTLQSGHRSRGAQASKKANQPTPEVDWDAAIARVKRILRAYYAKGGMEGPELDHERIEGSTE